MYDNIYISCFKSKFSTANKNIIVMNKLNLIKINLETAIFL